MGFFDLERWQAAALEATSNPVALLDSTEGGYILGVTLAFILPALRFVLDRTIYGVCHDLLLCLLNLADCSAAAFCQ